MNKALKMTDDQYEEKLRELSNALAQGFTNYDGNFYHTTPTALSFLSVMNKLRRLAANDNAIGHYIRQKFLPEIAVIDETLLEEIDKYMDVVNEFALRNVGEDNRTYPEVMQSLKESIDNYYKIVIHPTKDVIDMYKSACKPNMNYIAIDYNGKVYSYEAKPHLSDIDNDAGVWMCNRASNNYQYLGNILDENKLHDPSHESTIFYGHIVNASQLIFEI